MMINTHLKMKDGCQPKRIFLLRVV